MLYRNVEFSILAAKIVSFIGFTANAFIPMANGTLLNGYLRAFEYRLFHTHPTPLMPWLSYHRISFIENSEKRP